MNVRNQAQDAAKWYFSHLDPYKLNQENISQLLRGPVLALTVTSLQPPIPADVGKEATVSAPGAEKTVTPTADWRGFLLQADDETTSSHSFWNDEGQAEYEKLSRRTKARMEAFLAGCSLAVPGEFSELPGDRDSRTTNPQEAMVSLQEGLSGFRISKESKKNLKTGPPLLSSMKAQGKTLIRQISTRSSVKHPQIDEEDLITRLEIYLRTTQRIRTLKEDCVIAMEPPKSIKIRARYVTHNFIATAGCVRSMSPVLTRLLGCLTMEVLAVETLCDEVSRVIRRIVSEYEHETSFASLAFLSTPEANADALLTPLVVKYLKFLQSDWENLVKACELERMLTRCLDPTMRKLFKTIEFRSIGHLLEVFHEHRSKLHNIELAPNVCAVAENVNQLCDSKDAVKQALRDLQREIITVNGHVLPPVPNRKELLHLLKQTLNSRTLTAEPKSKRRSRKSRKGKYSYKRFESAPPKLDYGDESEQSDMSSMTKSPPVKKQNRPYDGEDGDVLFSSEYESSGMSEAQDSSEDQSKKPGDLPVARRKRNFHLSTIDLLTRRLLIAASRTGNGGDAYFVVRDLFGGDEVEVVTTNTVPLQGRMVRPGTIDILVRLSSVTIKCHQSFDVYPKALVGEVEPLIQFHTTTTETISLREVRTLDSQGEDVVPDNAANEDPQATMVVQEQRTSKTGWRTISIRPALYEKVEVWNTPS